MPDKPHEHTTLLEDQSCEFRYFLAQLRWEYPEASPESVRDALNWAKQSVGTEHDKILGEAREALRLIYG